MPSMSAWAIIAWGHNSNPFRPRILSCSISFVPSWSLNYLFFFFSILISKLSITSRYVFYFLIFQVNSPTPLIISIPNPLWTFLGFFGTSLQTHQFHSWKSSLGHLKPLFTQDNNSHYIYMCYVEETENERIMDRYLSFSGQSLMHGSLFWIITIIIPTLNHTIILGCSHLSHHYNLHTPQ